MTDDELRALGFHPAPLEDAKVVVLNTAHQEFACPDFPKWARAGVEVVLDGRNLWDQAKAEAAGLRYFGIGRSSHNEARSFLATFPELAYSTGTE